MMFWLPEGVLVDPCCALLVARLSVQSLQRCQGDDEPTSAFHAFSCFTVNFTVYTVFILQRFLMVWDECFSLSRGLSRLSRLSSLHIVLIRDLPGIIKILLPFLSICLYSRGRAVQGSLLLAQWRCFRRWRIHQPIRSHQIPSNSSHFMSFLSFCIFCWRCLRCLLHPFATIQYRWLCLAVLLFQLEGFRCSEPCLCDWCDI